MQGTGTHGSAALPLPCSPREQGQAWQGQKQSRTRASSSQGNPSSPSWIKETLHSQRRSSPDGSECAAQLCQALLCDSRVAEDTLCLLQVPLCLCQAGAQLGAPRARGQQGRGVGQAGLALPQALDVPTVGVEAGVAQVAAGVGATVALLALVTAGPGDTGAAQAAACGPVTARLLRALEVAVALWDSKGGGREKVVVNNFTSV